MDITKSHLFAELEKLSLNSVKSVQDGQMLNGLDAYLHVSRPIEAVLQAKMEEIDNSGGGIVLLIGIAGDGKSHLLSRMKEKFDWSQESYYNDATASCSPNKTAVATLKEALVDFSDKVIETTSRKLVLAINLGKLNAFIEDEDVNSKYSEIVKATKGIFDDDDTTDEIETDRIKIVLFAKEQMFEIYPDGEQEYPVEAKFLSGILEKIVNGDENNPFRKAYLADAEDEFASLNPILLNYKILESPSVRDSIVKIIIEAIVRFKLIITPREFLDFIYSIMVYRSPEPYEEKRDFFKALLPTLLFGGGENLIQKSVSHLDPVVCSSTRHDSLLAELFTSYAIPQRLRDEMVDARMPDQLLERVDVFYSNNGRDIEATTKFVFRLWHILDYHSESAVYTAFMSLLARVLNKQDDAYLQIYELVSRTIPRHFGSFTENDHMIPINVQGGKYKLFASINLAPQEIITQFDPSHPSRFPTSFYLKWKVGEKDVKLKVDYQLFEYLCGLDQGRLVTSYENDKNLVFNNFVRDLATRANLDEITILKCDGTHRNLKNTFGSVRFS